MGLIKLEERKSSVGGLEGRKNKTRSKPCECLRRLCSFLSQTSMATGEALKTSVSVPFQIKHLVQTDQESIKSEEEEAIC